MGFLKELFEKKLRNAKELADEDGLAVGPRVQSEFALPRLQQAQTMKESSLRG